MIIDELALRVRTGRMAGMGGQPAAASTAPTSPLVSFLIDRGPAILVASIVLVAVALAVRRLWLALALAAGAVMYWGMYVQGDLTVMYAAEASGLVALGALLVVAMRGRTPKLNA